MRGIPLARNRLCFQLRIIPAHAGNTGKLISYLRDLQDHPRSCGEYIDQMILSEVYSGSSPLMRGIPLPMLGRFALARIIPAHAGNTLYPSFLTIYMQDHPRSCGEYYHRRSFRLYVLGSSPLMRVILQALISASFPFRIIPAHAGNTIIVLRIRSS